MPENYMYVCTADKINILENLQKYDVRVVFIIVWWIWWTFSVIQIPVCDAVLFKRLRSPRRIEPGISLCRYAKDQHSKLFFVMFHFVRFGKCGIWWMLYLIEFVSCEFYVKAKMIFDQREKCRLMFMVHGIEAIFFLLFQSITILLRFFLFGWEYQLMKPTNWCSVFTQFTRIFCEIHIFFAEMKRFSFQNVSFKARHFIKICPCIIRKITNRIFFLITMETIATKEVFFVHNKNG